MIFNFKTREISRDTCKLAGYQILILKKNKKKKKDYAFNSLISLVGNRKTTVFVWNRAGAITALNEL
jgi:hypothetical protein